MASYKLHGLNKLTYAIHINITKLQDKTTRQNN